MVTIVIGAALSVAGGFVVSYIIYRLAGKTDGEHAQTFDIPPLPPDKWRIRKKNGAWIVSRREWRLGYGYRDMMCDRDVRYTDRYYYAAPNWKTALDYCRRRDMKEAK